MAEEQVEKRERKAREVLNDFGGTGDGNKSFFHKFGGFEKGDNAATKVIKDLQGLDAFKDGWQKACEGGSKLPVMEEMNGLFYLFGYFIKYLYQEGIPEWKEDETYYLNSFVKHNGVLYRATYGDANGFSGQEPKGAGNTDNYWGGFTVPSLAAYSLSAQYITSSNNIHACNKITSKDLTVSNTTTTKDLTVSNEAEVKDLVAENVTTDSATITGDNLADGSNSLDVTGNTKMTGDLVLTGNANLGSLDINGITKLNGNTYLGNDTNDTTILAGNMRATSTSGTLLIDTSNSWVGKIRPTNSPSSTASGYLYSDASGSVSVSNMISRANIAGLGTAATYNRDSFPQFFWGGVRIRGTNGAIPSQGGWCRFFVLHQPSIDNGIRGGCGFFFSYGSINLHQNFPTNVHVEFDFKTPRPTSVRTDGSIGASFSLEGGLEGWGPCAGKVFDVKDKGEATSIPYIFYQNMQAGTYPFFMMSTVTGAYP